MPERPGDIPIEERVNSGDSELSDFWPDEGNRAVDAHTAITRSPIRRAVYFGEKTRRDHQSTDRSTSYAEPVETPDWVITSQIELEGKKWNYRTPVDVVGVRRVFVERNQLIELDVEQSLAWIGAGEKGTPQYEAARKLLEAEASMDNVDNQVIMQLMYGRIERGVTLLPGGYALRSRSEPS